MVRRTDQSCVSCLIRSIKITPVNTTKSTYLTFILCGLFLPLPQAMERRRLVGRFVGDQEKMGGYQQQFYKLREEVNTAVTTMNSLREDGRMDELYAYRNQVQGLLNAKGQVRALERYMRNWRKRRDRIYNRSDINATVRSDMLLELQIERDKRLAMIPELRQKANIPPDTVGVILR